MSFSKIKTLLLYADYTDSLSYFDDWREAFQRHPDFAVTPINICDLKNLSLLKKRIADFDLIVLLHSALGDTLRFISPYQDILKERKAKLLAFVGNEVNLPLIPLQDKIHFLKDIAADFIGTQLPLPAGQWLYGESQNSLVVALPHALNPEVFRPAAAQSQRKIDIGTRTHKYGPYLGDNERNILLEYFLHQRFAQPLKIDISTTDRLSRYAWADFLNKCQGTISTEAGSYYLEKDDHTIKAIVAYLQKERPGQATRIINFDSRIQSFYEKLPRFFKPLIKNILYPLAKKTFNIKHQWQAFEGVEFAEIYEKFYRNYPANQPPVYTKAISSRHFDAIGTKTCQIMFKGKFNGILEADRHYLALEHDFSNIGEVMRRFLDPGFRQEMVDRAFEYVLSEHTYTNRLNTISKLLKS